MRWGGASWRGEADGGGSLLEGDAVEDGTAAEVGVEHAAIAVRGEEDVHREGGSEEGDFRGGLEGDEEAVRMRIRCRRRGTAPPGE
jgi:hypothetical protein